MTLLLLLVSHSLIQVGFSLSCMVQTLHRNCRSFTLERPTENTSGRCYTSQGEVSAGHSWRVQEILSAFSFFWRICNYELCPSRINLLSFPATGLFLMQYFSICFRATFSCPLKLNVKQHNSKITLVHSSFVSVRIGYVFWPWTEILNKSIK